LRTLFLVLLPSKSHLEGILIHAQICVAAAIGRWNGVYAIHRVVKGMNIEPLAKLLKQGGFRLRRGGVTVLK
jgi:hypothetical protein